jgi:hypothetical protein
MSIDIRVSEVSERHGAAATGFARIKEAIAEPSASGWDMRCTTKGYRWTRRCFSRDVSAKCAQ